MSSMRQIGEAILKGLATPGVHEEIGFHASRGIGGCAISLAAIGMYKGTPEEYKNLLETPFKDAHGNEYYDSIRRLKIILDLEDNLLFNSISGRHWSLYQEYEGTGKSAARTLAEELINGTYVDPAYGIVGNPEGFNEDRESRPTL